VALAGGGHVEVRVIVTELRDGDLRVDALDAKHGHGLIGLLECSARVVAARHSFAKLGSHLEGSFELARVAGIGPSVPDEARDAGGGDTAARPCGWAGMGVSP